MVESEIKIKKIIAEVLAEMGHDVRPSSDQVVATVDAAPLVDLTAEDLKKQLLVPEPANRDAYLKYKDATVSRLGIWRSGSRYKTSAFLRFVPTMPRLRMQSSTMFPTIFLKSGGSLR